MADVNKSQHWLSKSELGQNEIDKKQRLLCRKTQLRDQLSHHNASINDNFCQICKKHNKINKKETVKHALWSCFSLENLYEDLKKTLI